MTLLILDATDAPARVAWVSPDETRLWTPPAEFEGRSAEGLAAALARAFAEAPALRQEARRIVVARGPGSFTGVRSGVAMARATGLALSIPVVGVDGFSALAAMAAAAMPETSCVGVAYGSAARPIWRLYSGAEAAQPFDSAAIRSGPPPWSDAPIWFGPLAATAPDGVVRGAERPSVAILARLGEAAPEGAPAQPFYGRAPDATPSSHRPPARIAPAERPNPA